MSPPAKLTLDALTDWLGKQDPEGEYVWQDPVFCLMGRYLHDHDSCWGEVGYSEMPFYEEIAHQKPWTYGAALERAEKLKALPAPSAPPTQEPEHELGGRPGEGNLQPVLEYAGGSDQAQSG